MPQQRIVTLIYPNIHDLGFTGPLTVFETANHLLPDPASHYQVEIVSIGGPQITTSAGMTVTAAPPDVTDTPIDTLLIPGTYDNSVLADQELIQWIRTTSRHARRTASSSCGAFLLAEAGLLQGRRATTHWTLCHDMALRYPEITVEHEPMFVQDGPYVTSAGATASIYMALALIEGDHGPGLALNIARNLILPYRHHGNQSQYSSIPEARLTRNPHIRSIQEWILAHIDKPIRLPDLARRSHMSLRNFSRVFQRETGLSPAKYIEQMRVARARTLLETTDHPVRHVANQCGYTRPTTFYRTFQRTLGLTPAEYRKHFQST
ncbi:GlxA family transcriptional regulator (plasmid) [Kitasatospora sp. NBC_00070]|uniref:GlxA family transcriptional regulator n=1 Tax=Kitasatospora sp. NBC_00070 TaxID=2975962 RepID=UPI00324BB268